METESYGSSSEYNRVHNNSKKRDFCRGDLKCNLNFSLSLRKSASGFIWRNLNYQGSNILQVGSTSKDIVLILDDTNSVENKQPLFMYNVYFPDRNNDVLIGRCFLALHPAPKSIRSTLLSISTSTPTTNRKRRQKSLPSNSTTTTWTW